MHRQTTYVFTHPVLPTSAMPNRPDFLAWLEDPQEASAEEDPDLPRFRLIANAVMGARGGAAARGATGAASRGFAPPAFAFAFESPCLPPHSERTAVILYSPRETKQPPKKLEAPRLPSGSYASS